MSNNLYFIWKKFPQNTNKCRPIHEIKIENSETVANISPLLGNATSYRLLIRMIGMTSKLVEK